MTQRVAILLDRGDLFSSSTPDEERDKIMEDLADEALEPQLVHYGHELSELPETQIDVLVIDFGAMWRSPYVTDDWTRPLIEWAENHPSSLVMLWSSMTADEVGNEYVRRAEAAGFEMDYWADWPPNVRALHQGYSHRIAWNKVNGTELSGSDWYGESLDFLRQWFGITKPTRLAREIEEAGPLVAPGDE